MPSKYRDIFTTLKSQIDAGKYTSARRFPSEMELAGRFKVSRPTAARAIRELQALGLLERRAGSGTYLRSPQAPTDRRELGLIVSGLGNTEILDPICSEIIRLAQSQGMTVLWTSAANADTSPEHALSLCRTYQDHRVAGVFFAPLEIAPDRQQVNVEIATRLRNAGIAVVLLDRDTLDFPGRSDFDLVGIDNVHAGFVLADHLASVGHKRFAFIARPSHATTTDLRLAGCRDALFRRGLVPPPLASGDPADAGFVKTLLANQPDVMICTNDRTAAVLIQTLASIGVHPPGDVGVAGFDDVKYATLLSVPLTTIRQPCEQIGAAAFAQMRARIANPAAPPVQISLSTELIIRQSAVR